MKRKLEEGVSGEQNPAKLTKAITTGDIEEARRLIAEMNNEEINAVDKDGKTALHVATSKSHKVVCKLLISNMSSEAINVADKNSSTALHYSAFGGRIRRYVNCFSLRIQRSLTLLIKMAVQHYM
jgi:ankyrin repeat protein